MYLTLIQEYLDSLAGSSPGHKYVHSSTAPKVAEILAYWQVLSLRKEHEPRNQALTSEFAEIYEWLLLSFNNYALITSLRLKSICFKVIRKRRSFLQNEMPKDALSNSQFCFDLSKKIHLRQFFWEEILQFTIQILHLKYSICSYTIGTTMVYTLHCRYNFYTGYR